MGIDIACITQAQANDHVLHALGKGQGGWICPVNLDVLRQTVRNRDLGALVRSADLIVADGAPLVWASHLQGTPLPERIAGSALILSLSEKLASGGYSAYLLGGNHGTAKTAARLMEERFNGLKVAGWHCPPFGFEDSKRELDHIYTELEIVRPNMVFVGLGFPKQERLIAGLRRAFPQAWFLSCGVSFSFIAGDLRRAPGVAQRLGLEWVYRLVQEPRRLAGRYLRDGLPFALRLIATSAYRRLARRLR